MAEITDSKGAKHTLTFDRQIGTGAQGSVYSATLDGAPLGAKKITLNRTTILKFNADVKALARQLSVEIDLVTKLDVCRVSQGITCFKGIVANKKNCDLTKQFTEGDMAAFFYYNPGSTSSYVL